MRSLVSNRRNVFIWLGVVAGSLMNQATAAEPETYEALHADRERFIRHFRVHGELEMALAGSLFQRLPAFIAASSGEPRARALYELATMQRFLQRWEASLQTYAAAGAEARTLGLTDLAFEIEFGVAKSHALGTKNHGEAAAAVERAQKVAGPNPTAKQRYDLASYAAELQESWGDLDTGLVNALRAQELAANDTDLYFAQFSIGTLLEAYAKTCDYRPLVDAKSSEDAGNPYAAGFRAVAGAKRYYERARETARRLGWNHLAREMDGFLSRLEVRRGLIERKAAYEASTQRANIFNRQRRDEIIVNAEFAAGADSFADPAVMGPIIEQVTAGTGELDSRAFYLRGLKADLERQPKVALAHYQRSAELLARERFSMYELRGRSTVIENRIEHVRDLGLRLLALGNFDGAFDAFESIRARGMSALSGALAKENPTAQQRRWIAELVHLDSRESGELRGLVDTTIAGIEHSQAPEKLRALDETRAARKKLLANPEVVRLVGKLKASKPQLTTLPELRKTVDASDAAVLLYWSTPTNVVLWTIAKNISEVRTVFLPESELSNKVARIRHSLRPGSQFDTTVARELFTYLIAPVRDHYRGKRLIVVPQGPLVGLTFEALIDPETGEYLVEDSTISYAPNAHFAARVLNARAAPISTLQVVYDEGLEALTGEIARISEHVGGNVRKLKSNDLAPSAALQIFSKAPNLHVLLHGRFDEEDALLSALELNHGTDLRASELLAADWSSTKLVSFSSCEGATLTTRISNEVYGLAWAPLVAGVPRVLLSRWRVQQESNALWMAAFYEALAAKPSSASRASAAAMRELIRSTKYAHPFFWAAPQLFGG